MSMGRVESEVWTCPNGHFGNIMYGDAEELWGDTECPECGAEPGDPINPDAVTGDAPGVEDWIADHAAAIRAAFLRLRPGALLPRVPGRCACLGWY